MPAQTVKNYLDEQQIRYVTIGHSPAFTAQEIAASAHIKGQELAKTVIVKLDGQMAMVVLPAPRKINLQLLKDVTGERGDARVRSVIDDATSLSHALLKMPNVSDNITVHTDCDVMSFYESFLRGDDEPLRCEPTVTEIDRSSETWGLQEWCRQVVWYGMKKSAYFYGCQSREMQLAGHY